MGCRSFSYNSLFPYLLRIAKSHWLPLSQRSKVFYDPGPSVPQNRCNSGSLVNFQALRSYARDARKGYNLFGRGRPGDEEFKKTWAKEMDEDNNTLWTGSEDESDEDTGPKTDLDKEIRKARLEAKKHADLIDADDSHELRSVWSGSDEEKTLWTGDEMDSDDDIPTEAYPRKQARKIVVENALKKLKKGPDGRYTNVWEVMCDLDILIGAFENVVSGLEYAELRQGGPKLNIQFFKDIQARMRDPNYKFSPELKLKPKSKLDSRKKWQKAESRRRKARKR
ncbi:hypothetical protein JHK82_040216 [Glycine max]|nr:hypothetical protein JHK82_040216 [Glycine max]KAG5122284.1 hypothetical protein JHK84_040624 [Glycine max]